MMLNKRKCRAFADPDLKFPPNNGMLHASQIGYIVRTAVKIINHHKTLLLYIYSREQIIQGNLQPCMTVFHSKDDFTTLASKEDGNTVWRTASFDRLNGRWNFAEECAFYSDKDAKRVSRYFNNNTDTGFTPLIKAQDAIIARRRKERKIAKEKSIIDRMAGIPTLPRSLKSWIHKIMPAYFFYDYRRGSKNTSGVCSACGQKIILAGVKQGKTHTCPHCKHELIAKPRSRRGADMCDRDTCEVIQSMGDGRLVVRIIKVYYHYKSSDTPNIQVYENARQFVWQDTDKKVHTEHYYYDHNSGLLTDWRKGTRPVYVPYYYYFEADTCGHLYTQNLPDALIGTPWQYCPIDIFYNHFHEPMQALPYLISFPEHPRMEHLVKAGFCQITADLAYHYESQEIIDETKNRTHQILHVAAEDIPFLRDLDVNLSTLRIFQQYNGLKDRQELLLWQLDHKVTRDILPILHCITAHKMMRYLDEQYSFLCLRQTRNGTVRYKEMQDLVSEYRDYLEMCQKMGYDMKNSFVLYPKDLQKSHDKTAHRLKHKIDTKMRRDFVAIYKNITGKFDFEKYGLKIMYPATPDDVIAEGQMLHHCVGDYIDRVANQKCIILFLRQCEDEAKPYYTIEVRGQKAVQVRGMGNCTMTEEVEKFIQAWERQVLSKIKLAA